jgi:hypothetical protein
MNTSYVHAKRERASPKMTKKSEKSEKVKKKNGTKKKMFEAIGE